MKRYDWTWISSWEFRCQGLGLIPYACCLKEMAHSLPDLITLLSPLDASIDIRIFASRMQNICKGIISPSLISATKMRFQVS